ncbi:MAG: hypothetical protein VZS44_05840 [Bacilli bacterium]|nr:hypothetical protein [Bacilli bacterium]
MNNNLNLINQISKGYNLTAEQFNLITTKYQSDTRDQNIIIKEITNTCDFYRFQNNLKNIIANTPALPEGKNYYITAFDQNSNFYLQPVSIAVTNPEKSEVIVDNSFKGYQKHTQVDDIEISLCQFGSALGFEIEEEYRVYNANKEKNSIVIKNIINEDEFYDLENLNKRFFKLINAGKYKKEEWFEKSEQLKVANTKEDYVTAIDYGLKILKSLPSITEEDFKQIEEKYFEMIIYDCLINQSERNFKDYGILCDKETKRYKYAPLFDNAFPSILKNNDILSFNGITCNRYELMECLFYNYYDKIEKKVTYILNNKDKILNTASMIFKYNLDLNSYNMLINNIVTNINYFERILNEKAIIERNQQNAGYADIFHIVLALGIVFAFSFIIAFLLFTTN